MIRIVKVIFVYSCLLILLSSCAMRQVEEGRGQGQNVVAPLNCIAVLPATSSTDGDETINYEQAQSLEKGAFYASQVLRAQLQGHPKVKILTSHQLSTLTSEVSGGISGTIAALSKKLDCQGVLLTYVSRFQQREGTDYSVESPAAVELLMVLRDGTSGRVLWSGDFSERQQSLLSNILSFSKAQKRGFKWVSAEQLMEQGIKHRLDQCPYLQ